jgi:hypothetical protein
MVLPEEGPVTAHVRDFCMQHQGQSVCIISVDRAYEYGTWKTVLEEKLVRKTMLPEEGPVMAQADSAAFSPADVLT